MLFIIASVLWIIVLAMSIGDRFKKSNNTQQVIQHEFKQYKIGSVEENIVNKWIINYIKSKGNKVNYSELKNDFSIFISKQLNNILISMVNDNIIDHGIDTESFEEFFQIKEVIYGE